MDDAAYREKLQELARLHHRAEHDKETREGARGFSKWVAGVYDLETAGYRIERILDDLRRVNVPCARCRDPVVIDPKLSIFHLFDQVLKRPDWRSNEREPLKAYALSCFAQLSYMRLSRYDVEGSDRYDFVPSEHLDGLIEARQSLALEQAFAEADLPFLIVERPFFTYLATLRDDYAIVAVRGTAKASEWLTNLNAQKIGAGDAEPDYHPGFMREAWDGMIELRAKLGPALDRPHLYFTGHSLGGAIAALLAPRMNGQTAYVFGSPRFGNASAVAAAEPYAYVRPDDLVPHLPPSALGYADAASSLEVVGDGQPVQAAGWPTLQSWLTPGRRFAVQHAVEGYCRHLARAAGVPSPELAFLEMRRSYARPFPNPAPPIP